MNDKVEFKIEDKEYYVQFPSARQEKDGMIVFAKALTKAVQDGIMSQDRLDKYCRDQGVWNDEKQKNREDIETFIRNGVDTLAKGGVKKSEARTLAIQMRRKRFELMALLMDRTKLEGFTAEALADKERTAYFISCCTKNKDGTRVFASIEDYCDKENDVIGKLAEYNYAKLTNGFDDDFQSKWPEVEFLTKYGFVNADFNLVNAEGKFVDEEGNEIKEPEKVEFTEFLEG